MAISCSRERPKANGTVLASQGAYSDEGTGWVACDFVGFERRVSVVISASQCGSNLIGDANQQLDLRHILTFFIVLVSTGFSKSAHAAHA